MIYARFMAISIYEISMARWVSEKTSSSHKMAKLVTHIPATQRERETLRYEWWCGKFVDPHSSARTLTRPPYRSV